MRVDRKTKRRAISELVATLIMVTVTLIAGAAVLGWVNGQAGTSEKAYGNSAANNINYLNERYAVESQVFSGTGSSGQCSGGTPPYTDCTGASFYLYNDGSVTFTLYSIQIESMNPTTYPLNIIFYTSCASSGTCQNPPAASPCSGNQLSCSREEVTAAPAGSGCSSATPCYPTFTAAGSTTIPTGFYVTSGITYTVPPQLPQGSLTSSPYQITLPSVPTVGQLYMYDTVAYTVIFTGLFGNTVQETITANG